MTVTLKVGGDSFAFKSLHEATVRVRKQYDSFFVSKQQLLEETIQLGRWLVALRACQEERAWRQHGSDGWRAHLARYNIHYKMAQRAMRLAEWDQAGRPDGSSRAHGSDGADGTDGPISNRHQAEIAAGIRRRDEDDELSGLSEADLDALLAESGGGAPPVEHVVDHGAAVPWEEESDVPAVRGGVDNGLQLPGVGAGPAGMSPGQGGGGGLAGRGFDADISGCTTSGRSLSGPALSPNTTGNPPSMGPATTGPIVSRGTQLGARISPQLGAVIDVVEGKGASGEQLHLAALYELATKMRGATTDHVVLSLISQIESRIAELQRGAAA